MPGYIHTFNNTLMRNLSWADLTEDEFGEQWIHGTSAEPKSIKEHRDLDDQMCDYEGQCKDNWLAIFSDPSSSIGEMQYFPPTLLEALNLALTNTRDSSDQVPFPNEVDLPIKKRQQRDDFDSLHELPLKVIILPGRGRNRTGPLKHWPPKRVRHCSCVPKRRNNVSVDPCQYESIMCRRRIWPQKTRRNLPTLDAMSLQTIRDEREARRATFDEFATSLNLYKENERKFSQRGVSKRAYARSAQKDTT